VAKNEVYENGDQLAVTCTDPTTPASGDPVRYGERPGVALIAEAADGLTTVTFRGVYNLSVKAVDGGGNSAVAEGDILYYVDADTPKISKKTAGHRFGYAGAAITSGSTATIAVHVGY
jgi:predicted RecA/RadA family phage recombinase